jgi:hypothetical protein
MPGERIKAIQEQFRGFQQSTSARVAKDAEWRLGFRQCGAASPRTNCDPDMSLPRLNERLDLPCVCGLPAKIWHSQAVPTLIVGQIGEAHEPGRRPKLPTQ